jgi:hypothetical protein
MLKNPELDLVLSAPARRKPSAELPAFVNVSQLISVEAIAETGVPEVIKLAERYSPDGVFPVIQNKKDASALFLAFRGYEISSAQPFINAWGAAHAMSDDDSLELLRREGFVLNPEHARGRMATDALLSDPDRFVKAYDRWIGSESFGGKRYRIYGSGKLKPEERPKSVSPDLIRQAKGECDRYFSGKGCGRVVSVHRFQADGKRGFLVLRGNVRSGKAKMDPKDQLVTRQDRDVRTDIVYFDERTARVWISSPKADSEFYAGLMGELLLGNRGRFGRLQNLNLDFALAKSLAEVLLQSRKGSPELKAVTLRNRRVVDLPNGAILPHSVRSRYGCLSESNPLDPADRDTGRVDKVKIGLILQSKEYHGGAIALTEDSISITPTIEHLAFPVLEGLGVFRFDGK